jgi:hypothetical protein
VRVTRAGYGGGEVCARAAMRHGRVRLRCFLASAPVAAAMKGPWWLRRRGPGMGAAAMVTA